MTEKSWVWGGTTTGDATLAPYDDDEWSDVDRKVSTANRATQGIIAGYANALAVSGATSPVAVETGAAMVDGKFYENENAESVAIPTPSGATRVDRIVLRKSWSAQTVRITRIGGVEGGGAPSLVQSDGVTWDIPLAQVSITTGGVITITDQRMSLFSPTRPALRRSDEASSATPTIKVNLVDVHRITALAVAITSMTTNLIGTPEHGQRLVIEILDNGTARAITWGASFRSTDSGTLPTTTTLSKLLRVGLMYDSVDAVWDCVVVSNEA